MLGPMIFNSAHPKSEKIQIIGIQSRPDLDEQKNYDEIGFFRHGLNHNTC
jgi:hypothetical protein